jgi:hypothetical protein
MLSAPDFVVVVPGHALTSLTFVNLDMEFGPSRF